MNKFSDLANKSTCEIYTLKIQEKDQWKCCWAKIIIDSKSWSFSCLSDVGNFSYRWHAEEHRTFKKFLTEINMGYLMRKIESRAKEFDFEATVENLKKGLFETRRSDDIDKKDAREVFDIINNLDYGNSEDLVIYQLIEGHRYFGNDVTWTCDQIVKRHTPEAITFTELVFPLLQEALKIELSEVV